MQTLIEKDNLICNKHNLRCFAVNIDQSLKMQERLICENCFIQLQHELSLVQVDFVIKEIQKKQENVINETNFKLQEACGYVVQFQQSLNLMKSNLDSIFKKIEQITSKWIQEINQIATMQEQNIFEDIEKYYIIPNSTVIQLNKIYNSLQQIHKQNYQQLSQELIQVKQIINYGSIDSDLKKIFSYINSDIQKDSLLFNNIKNEQINTPSFPILCEDHNKQIIHLDIDSHTSQLKRALCTECISQKTKQTISVEEFKKKWNFHLNTKFKKIKNRNAGLITELRNLINLLGIIKEDQNNSFQNTMDFLQEKWLQHIWKLKLKNSNLEKIRIDQIQSMAEELSDQSQQYAEDLELIDIIKNIKLDVLMQMKNIAKLQQQKQKDIKKLIKCENNDIFVEIEEDEDVEVLKNNIKLLTNQLKEEQSFKKLSVLKTQNCCAISFNYLSQIMISSEKNSINVWKIENNQLFFYKTLISSYGLSNFKNKKITCLIFSKLTNNFYSASEDGIITFWKEENLEWIENKSNYSIQFGINQIILNNLEDEMYISSNTSFVSVVKIQKLTNQLSELQNLQTGENKAVLSIALNTSNSTLISCNLDKTVIMWKKKNQLWEQKFQIQLADISYRVCFINEEEFAIQRRNLGITYVYKIEGENFKELIQLELNRSTNDADLFPSCFYARNNILIQKHNKFIYFFERINQEKYQLKYFIESQSPAIYGASTLDGQYFAYSDIKLKEITFMRVI